MTLTVDLQGPLYTNIVYFRYSTITIAVDLSTAITLVVEQFREQFTVKEASLFLVEVNNFKHWLIFDPCDMKVI